MTNVKSMAIRNLKSDRSNKTSSSRNTAYLPLKIALQIVRKCLYYKYCKDGLILS